MSDGDGDEWQELVTALEFFQIANYCEAAVVALLVYDHVLTFAGELRFVWRRKFSGATVVFALNRYVTIFGKIILLVSTMWWPNQTDQTCAPPVILVMIFTIIAYFIAAIFSALRIYAIWDRDWRPFILVLAVALAVPATNMYHYIESIPIAAEYPFYGCGEGVALNAEQFAKLSIATHTCAIATDLLVLVLTWMKTYEINRIATSLHLKTSLYTLILRDGTHYFVVLLILNVIDLIIDQSDALFNPMPIFIDAFTCILISRFMLNLREVVRSPQCLAGRPMTSTVGLSQLTTLRIAHPDIVGDLGAPLSHGTNWTGTTHFADPSADVDAHEDDECAIADAGEKVGPLWTGLVTVDKRPTPIEIIEPEDDQPLTDTDEGLTPVSGISIESRV